MRQPSLISSGGRHLRPGRWLRTNSGAAGFVMYCGELGRVDLRCTDCGESMQAGDVDDLPGPGAAA
ncbi:hypothetical protein ACFVKB_01135 [Rhodococcus sp. NPDC127530]|uniref:hypothetical protein n=1 Tax=unclassified Rhodococcus (in: high G+C Gram-positive bacteria) TaxID=192944 RepID=UPI003634D296